MSDRTQVHALYREAGFGRPTRRGVCPAVVVVDLQNGFTDPAVPTGAEMSSEVAATNRLITAARDLAVPVIFTAIAFPPGVSLAWLDKSPGLAALRRDSPLVEIDGRLVPLSSEPVIHKTGASAFFGTSLASVLTSARVDTVLVCGATTSGCVRATAVDAVQCGFSTLVVADCVGDRAKEPHRAALFDLQAKYADVVSVEEALGQLSVGTHQTSGNEA